MGFLDKAKKLAEQARGMAEDALAEAKSRIPADVGGGGRDGGGGARSVASDPRRGTPYMPGMLGRAGWRERGLTDPAAVLPVGDRDAAGIPHSTRSVIVAEPYGVGRRWTSGGRSAGLFYQLDPDHQQWETPLGRAPFAGVRGAWSSALPDGRTLVFVGTSPSVVVEMSGLDEAEQVALVRAAADQLAAGG